MPTSKPHSWQAMAKEAYVGAVGWIWAAASLVSIYFAAQALFFDDAWWPVVASAVVAWVFYKVSLYYLLERNDRLVDAKVEVGLSPLKNHSPEHKAKDLGAKKTAEGGLTQENAIRIHAANSLEGIPKEYAILRAMLGTENKDWKLIERILIHADDGRKIERFIISVGDQRKDIYFDITEWFSGNTSKEVKTILEKIITQHDKLLTILLPKEEFMTLQSGLLRLTDAQLNQLGLSLADRINMLDPLLDALKPWHGREYENIPEHVGVTTLISVWSKIMGLLVSWQPVDLLQEEELENLKAIIDGTMKEARRSA